MSKATLIENFYSKVTKTSLLLFLLIISNIAFCNETIYAKKAQIDLSNYDFSTAETKSLQGKWCFLPGVLTKNVDSILRYGKPIEIGEQDWQSLHYTNFGYGSYCVCITLHNKYKTPQYANTLGLKIRNIYDSYRLYLNGELIISQGAVSKDNQHHKMQMGYRTVFFTPTSNHLTLVFEVANNLNNKFPGIQEPIDIGSQHSIYKESFFKMLFFMICLGIMFLFALYHLVFYFFNSSTKDSLYFAIVCVMFALKCMFDGDKLIFALDDNFSTELYYRAWFISTSIVYFLTEFYYTQFPKDIKHQLVVVTRWIFLIFCTLMLILPLSWCFPISRIIYLGCIFLIVYVCYIVTVAALHKRNYAWWHLSGMLFSALFGINDLLYSMSVIQTGNYSAWSFAIYIALISTILSYKAVKAFRSVESLTTELTKTNLNLESLVEKRTEQLHLSNKELLKLIATRDRFFSILAHDLRGPISTTRALLDLMIVNHKNYTAEKTERMIQALSNSSHATYNLLENLLQWAKAQRTEVLHSPQWYDMNDLIAETCTLFTLTLQQKNITLSTQTDQSLKIYCDANSLTTVLRNLINNAIKFTPTGGSIVVSATKSQTGITLMVQDTGVGMSPEVIATLFEKDVVLQSQHGTSGEKGSGLGFVLCREFVKLHGGTIRVESEPGKGSCFIVDIPDPDEGF